MKQLTDLKIGIVGLGLIGGSLALRLAAEGFKIVAVVRDTQNFAQTPFELVSSNPKELANCDVVFVCVPLNAVVQTLQDMQPYLKSGAIVSEVGSVKGFICEAAAELMRKDCYFIGGHPMAGTEKVGFANAFATLFEDRPWALMQNNYAEQTQTLSQIVQKTGAKLLLTNPQEHDKAVALISHLPLLLSMSLLNTIENLQDQKLKELALSLASSGFESMTRLAKGNQELNKDLLKFNEKNLQESTDEFVKTLRLIKKD
jgi:arogenate dehydrogenase (NADP+)